MKKAYKITVSGKVQKRGYRNKVFQLANELDVNGYVKNLPTGEVEIVAEHANEAILQQFIRGIRTVNGLVKVVDAKVESIISQGYGDFEIIRGDKQDEMLESMDFGAQYLADISNAIREVSGKQDQMLGKHDETIAAIREVSGKQDETRSEIKGLRSDLGTFLKKEVKEIINAEVADIRRELKLIKQKVGA